MEIKRNQEHNGIEIYFDGKPGAATIAALKEKRFRWHSAKKCWYAVATAVNVDFAETLTGDGQTVENAAKRAHTGENKAPAPALNAYGVKVGDLFYADWGYDQTNINFFQVVALLGSQSVRVREVVPHIVNSKENGGMARYITAAVPKSGEVLPAVSHSIFINDQERGDIKKLKTLSDGEIIFKVGQGGYICNQYNGGELYESWYA